MYSAVAKQFIQYYQIVKTLRKFADKLKSVVLFQTFAVIKASGVAKI